MTMHGDDRSLAGWARIIARSGAQRVQASDTQANADLHPVSPAEYDKAVERAAELRTWVDDVAARKAVEADDAVPYVGDTVNGGRAARAKDAVAAYVDLVGGGYDVDTANGNIEAITDLLADLRHYCAELDVDFNELEHRAWTNYHSESSEDER